MYGSQRTVKQITRRDLGRSHKKGKQTLCSFQAGQTNKMEQSLEKLTVPQLVMKFACIYGTRRFIRTRY
jgi:hypothetical protein